MIEDGSDSAKMALLGILDQAGYWAKDHPALGVLHWVSNGLTVLSASPHQPKSYLLSLPTMGALLLVSESTP